MRRLLTLLVALLATLALAGPASAHGGNHGGGHGHDPVTVCHKPGTPAQQELTIDKSALGKHLRHGDTKGECPDPEPEIPEAPEPWTGYGEWSDWAVDCEAGYAERGRWTWEVTYEWDGAEWQPVVGPDVAELDRRDLTAEELAVCNPIPPQPDAIVEHTSGENWTCDGYFTRGGTITTEYVLVDNEWVLGEPVTEWGDWVKQRDLTVDEVGNMDGACGLPPAQESWTCDGYFAGGWDWVDGEWVAGDLVKQRDLTDEELANLQADGTCEAPEPVVTTEEVVTSTEPVVTVEPTCEDPIGTEQWTVTTTRYTYEDGVLVNTEVIDEYTETDEVPLAEDVVCEVPDEEPPAEEPTDPEPTDTPDAEEPVVDEPDATEEPTEEPTAGLIEPDVQVAAQDTPVAEETLAETGAQNHSLGILAAAGLLIAGIAAALVARAARRQD